jgi:protein-S-isoprenylcysteine O-methyltransferase Ste14
MGTILLDATAWGWTLFELSLLVRDRVRGLGSTAADRGTRRLTIGLVLLTFVLADVLAAVIGKQSPLRIPDHQEVFVAGLLLMWLGLAVRVWAVVTLGRSFRTTVEVNAGQAVVTRGPYRLIRHPSYTGILLITTGFGLAAGDWPALALCLVIPTVSMLRRIQVEEAELTQVLGEPYRAYREHTRRLIPGVW